MELLQTIWTALTIQNEGLLHIISIPFTFIEAYLTMLLSIAIVNIKVTNKQKFLYFFIISIFGIIGGFFIPTPLNVYLNYALLFACIIFIFKTSILKSLIAFVFPILINAFFQTIITVVYSIIFGMNFENGITIPIYRILASLLGYFLLYSAYYISNYFGLNISKLEILNKKNKTILSIIIILAIILISFQIYMVVFYISNLPVFITILSIIFLVSFFTLSLYIIYTALKLENTATNLEESQLYNKTLELLHDDTRAFRHDMSNISLGMLGYIERNDIDGLKKYYNDFVEDLQKVNNLTTLSPKVVNNPAIYNVLANKYHKADSLGIKIKLEAFLDLNNLHMKTYEFTRVLGILMDNAIEATSECNEKIINVTIRKDPRKNMQLLIIENTYSEKDIDTEQIYKKGFSSKKEKGNTGLGLWEIRQILKKNNNLNLFTTKNDEFFVQQFEIYY